MNDQNQREEQIELKARLTALEMALTSVIWTAFKSTGDVERFFDHADAIEERTLANLSEPERSATSEQFSYILGLLRTRYQKDDQQPA